ncbi:hypothetical protein SS50377_25658 [Spironucleus salmonicida]|uniref:G domain-containing protein n=1 Tax=Spironucleus salmonicida TaxID=348837 RepID=V6LYU5_9EUKA|nr:hypothetical protein SS50377_25658 [Spironucleus salmonicida]|eukprot:EST49443.1 Hypothetical protein SS50377_10190 [Spironucleus salmonicida]
MNSTTVAIIGAKNTGKSSLATRLAYSKCKEIESGISDIYNRKLVSGILEVLDGSNDFNENSDFVKKTQYLIVCFSNTEETTEMLNLAFAQRGGEKLKQCWVLGLLNQVQGAFDRFDAICLDADAKNGVGLNSIYTQLGIK